MPLFQPFCGQLPTVGQIYFSSLDFAGQFYDNQVSFGIKPLFAFGLQQPPSSIPLQNPCLYLQLNQSADQVLFWPVRKIVDQQLYGVDFSDWLSKDQPYRCGAGWASYNRRSSESIPYVDTSWAFFRLLEAASFGWFFLSRFAQPMHNQVEVLYGEHRCIAIKSQQQMFATGWDTGFQSDAVEHKMSLYDSKQILTGSLSLSQILQLYTQNKVLTEEEATLLGKEQKSSFLSVNEALDPPANASQPEILCPVGIWQRPEGQLGNQTLPEHTVRFTRPFYMATQLVSQAQWQAVMGSNPSSHQHAQHPVTQVSAKDAMRFCNSLSTQQGLEPAYAFERGLATCNFKASGYRLPTETEWERAASMHSTPAEPAKAGAPAHPFVYTRSIQQGGESSAFGEIFELCWGFSADTTQDSYARYAAQGEVVDPTGPLRNAPIVRKGNGRFVHDEVPLDLVGLRLVRTSPQDMWEQRQVASPIDELLAGANNEQAIALFAYPEIVEVFANPDISAINQSLQQVELWLQKGRILDIDVHYREAKGTIRLPAALSMAPHGLYIALSLLVLKAQVGQFAAASVEVLDLTDTKIAYLPAGLSTFTELRELLLRGTQVAELPASIASLTKLEELDCFFTKVPEVPLSFVALYERFKVVRGQVKYAFRFVGPSAMKANVGLLQLQSLSKAAAAQLADVSKVRCKQKDWDRLSQQEQESIQAVLAHAELRIR